MRVEEFKMTMKDNLTITDRELDKIRVRCLENFPQILGNIPKDQTLINNLIKDIKDLPGTISAIIQVVFKARKQNNWVIAIDFLEDVIKHFKPVFEAEKFLKDSTLQTKLLFELYESFYYRGQLNKAEEIVDVISKIFESLSDFKGYIESQYNKIVLQLLKGRHSQANKLLNEILNYSSKLSEEEKSTFLPKIYRSLAVEYRDYGDYGKALEWFSKAMTGFQAIKSDIGVSNTLWGLARLHRLRGEWAKAIETYKLILKDYSSLYATKKAGLKLFKLYIDLAESYYHNNELPKAEKTLKNALNIAQKEPTLHNAAILAHLHLAKCYTEKKMFDEALKTVHNADSLWNEAKEKVDKFEVIELVCQMCILELETEILIELDEQDEAKEKLEAAFSYLKNEWDIANWYLLIGHIEKKNLNLRSAQESIKQALVKIKEIGHYRLSLVYELEYCSLLKEKARLGDQKALEQAKNQIEELENEVQTKFMPAMVLELKILRTELLTIQKEYDQVYQLLSEVEDEARMLNLNKQLVKAQEHLIHLEKEQFALREGLKKSNYFQILKYLQDARRIAGRGQ